jgi:hypothetical protein
LIATIHAPEAGAQTSQKQNRPRWWGRIRHQARVARSLQDGGLLNLSETATEALHAIDNGLIGWETIRALFEAWNSREDLRQLAPDGLFDREDRREYGRWYAERQFEMFGLLLLALGVLREGGTS